MTRDLTQNYTRGLWSLVYRSRDPNLDDGQGRGLCLQSASGAPAARIPLIAVLRVDLFGLVFEKLSGCI